MALQRDLDILQLYNTRQKQSSQAVLIFQFYQFLVDDAIKKSKKALNKFMELDLFLITDINLKDAAFRLNIPKYKLTEYIKIAGFENFYQFVNHLRIIKSKELLTHLPDNNSIDSVIGESGFNSRSTFYRVFKENCGITPSEYLKTIQ